MINKPTAYQKLKAENLKLKQDLYVLTQLNKSEKPDDVINYFSVKAKWDIRFNMEKTVWGGSH